MALKREGGKRHFDTESPLVTVDTPRRSTDVSPGRGVLPCEGDNIHESRIEPLRVDDEIPWGAARKG